MDIYIERERKKERESEKRRRLISVLVSFVRKVSSKKNFKKKHLNYIIDD